MPFGESRLNLACLLYAFCLPSGWQKAWRVVYGSLGDLPSVDLTDHSPSKGTEYFHA